jgi:hypothetical protein
MKRDQIEEGRISNHSHGLGTVTQEMVRERAREIAIINGRSTDHISPADFAQAKRELTGHDDPESAEEKLPTWEHWDPVPGTVGHAAPLVSPHDEQTDSEKLIEEGISEAEHEHMVEGTKESLRRGE